MAKIYAAPKEIRRPTFDPKAGWEALRKKEHEYLNALAAYYRQHFKGEYVGEVIRTPRADGYAIYMVIRQQPLSLAHIDIGDGWRADEIWERGLRLSDVKQMVQRSRNPLFGNSSIKKA